MAETATEQAILSALWKALEAQDVPVEIDEPTWINGFFEKGQLAFNMIALLRRSGYVVLPKEQLTEALARSLAAQGHSLGVDNMVPLPSLEPWGDSPGEQPMWKGWVATAEQTIADLERT